MPKIQTTKIYNEIENAKKKGYTTISLQGSSRSSKTYNVLIWLIVYCLNNQNTRISIVRATLPSIKGSVFIDFKEILTNMRLFEEKRLNKSELTYTFSNGSWVEFFSTDSEQKLRGRKRDILFVNEANEISFIEWQQLKMRTAVFTLVDYNPSFSDDHWLCNLNNERRTKHVITTYKDNPFLEQTIIDEIESLQHKNKSLWTIYGLGLQAQIEGLIFPKYEIIDQIPQWVKVQGRGMDLGYKFDPTAIVDCAIYEDNIYLDELCYRTHMLTSDIIEELKKQKGKIISESADPRIIQEIANAGILIYPVKKYKGSVIAGLTKMMEYKIHITRRSVNVKKELDNYTWLQDKDGAWLNEPIDKYNHAIDAARYWILGEIMGQIQEQNKISKEDLYVTIF
jgi:phage terminase large subunit